MGKFLTDLNRKLKSEAGIGTVEIILILVVLIALVVLFRNEILELAESIFGEVNDAVQGVY